MSRYYPVRLGYKNLCALSSKLISEPIEVQQIRNGKRETCWYSQILVPHQNAKEEKGRKAISFYLDTRNIADIDNGKKLIAINPEESLWVNVYLDSWGKDGKQINRTYSRRFSYNELSDLLYTEGINYNFEKFGHEYSYGENDILKKVFVDENSPEYAKLDIQEKYGEFKMKMADKFNDCIKLPNLQTNNFGKPYMLMTTGDDSSKKICFQKVYINLFGDSFKEYQRVCFSVQTNYIVECNKGKSAIFLPKDSVLSVEFDKYIGKDDDYKDVYETVKEEKMSSTDIRDLLVDLFHEINHSKNKEINNNNLKSQESVSSKLDTKQAIKNQQKNKSIKSPQKEHTIKANNKLI